MFVNCNQHSTAASRLCRKAAIAAALSLSTAAHAAICISTVVVANAGNAADTRTMNDGTTGYGQVNYAYSIGKYEVTAGQYTSFLNAVASTDTYGLYNTAMASDVAGCQIIRSGTSGAYTYSVASDYANRPVNYVSWGDSARFSNWLANNQPTGTETAGTTETGSYTLSGATSNASLLSVTRNASATWVISSEDEWYKAAFYNAATATYSLYATGSNTLPSNDLVTPDPGNNANYLASQTDSTLTGSYYRTEAGAFSNSDSSYGTFDQDGNVWEWNESTYATVFREMRGGSAGSYDLTLAANFRYLDQATYESNTVGFRVASTVVIVPGDFNADGVANAKDIDLLFSATQGAVPPASATFDVTGDGIVNSKANQTGSDADNWVRTIKLTEYGDANLDQHVNFDDLIVLAQNYNSTTATSWALGNFDGAGGVNFDDLILLAQHYGFGASSSLAAADATLFSDTFWSDWQLALSLVPEPSVLSLATAALVATRRRRTSAASVASRF